MVANVIEGLCQRTAFIGRISGLLVSVDFAVSSTVKKRGPHAEYLRHKQDPQAVDRSWSEEVGAADHLMRTVRA